MHERSHRNLGTLVAHCRGLDDAAVDREIDGFGYPTIRLQLHHVIGAQEYWIGVLLGKYLVDDNEGEFPTIARVEEYRLSVKRMTEEYLAAASEAELNTPREMLTYPQRLRVLVPAHVCLRTIMHAYHHQGQILAMCRLLGHPGPGGTDFPIDPELT